jgi:hypothetical protein
MTNVPSISAVISPAVVPRSLANGLARRAARPGGAWFSAGGLLVLSHGAHPIGPGRTGALLGM